MAYYPNKWLINGDLLNFGEREREWDVSRLLLTKWLNHRSRATNEGPLSCQFLDARFMAWTCILERLEGLTAPLADQKSQRMRFEVWKWLFGRQVALVYCKIPNVLKLLELLLEFCTINKARERLSEQDRQTFCELKRFKRFSKESYREESSIKFNKLNKVIKSSDGHYLISISKRLEWIKKN